MKKFLKLFKKQKKEPEVRPPVKQETVNKPKSKPMCLVRVYHNRVCYDNRGIKTEANFFRDVWMPCDEIPASGTYKVSGGYGYEERVYKILK